MGWLDNWRETDTVNMSVPEGAIDLCNSAIIVQTKTERPMLYGRILSREILSRSMIHLPVLTAETAAESQTPLIVLVVDRPGSSDLGDGQTAPCPPSPPRLLTSVAQRATALSNTIPHLGSPSQAAPTEPCSSVMRSELIWDGWL